GGKAYRTVDGEYKDRQITTGVVPGISIRPGHDSRDVLAQIGIITQLRREQEMLFDAVNESNHYHLGDRRRKHDALEQEIAREIALLEEIAGCVECNEETARQLAAVAHQAHQRGHSVAVSLYAGRQRLDSLGEFAKTLDIFDTFQHASDKQHTDADGDVAGTKTAFQILTHVREPHGERVTLDGMVAPYWNDLSDQDVLSVNHRAYKDVYKERQIDHVDLRLEGSTPLDVARIYALFSQANKIYLGIMAEEEAPRTYPRKAFLKVLPRYELGPVGIIAGDLESDLAMNLPGVEESARLSLKKLRKIGALKQARGPYFWRHRKIFIIPDYRQAYRFAKGTFIVPCRFVMGTRPDVEPQTVLYDSQFHGLVSLEQGIINITVVTEQELQVMRGLKRQGVTQFARFTKEKEKISEYLKRDPQLVNWQTARLLPFDSLIAALAETLDRPVREIAAVFMAAGQLDSITIGDVEIEDDRVLIPLRQALKIIGESFDSYHSNQSVENYYAVRAGRPSGSVPTSFEIVFLNKAHRGITTGVFISKAADLRWQANAFTRSRWGYRETLRSLRESRKYKEFVDGVSVRDYVGAARQAEAKNADSQDTLNAYPRSVPQRAFDEANPQYTRARMVVEQDTYDDYVFSVKHTRRDGFRGKQKRSLSKALMAMYYELVRQGLTDEELAAIRSTMAESTVIITTRRMGMDPRETVKNPVAACHMDEKIVYLHPYFFRLPLYKQVEILYHELISHIHKGIEDEAKAMGDTNEFGSKSQVRHYQRIFTALREYLKEKGYTYEQWDDDERISSPFERRHRLKTISLSWKMKLVFRGVGNRSCFACREPSASSVQFSPKGAGISGMNLSMIGVGPCSGGRYKTFTQAAGTHLISVGVDESTSRLMIYVVVSREFYNGFRHAKHKEKPTASELPVRLVSEDDADFCSFNSG
ncbi:hypothetical protein ACFL2W_00865, partial [Candidatus Omnitrophota bacterium]